LIQQLISFSFLKKALFSPIHFIWFSCFFLIQAISVDAQEIPPGFVFTGGYTFDLAANMQGGLKQGGAFLGNIDLNFEWDTEALHLWKGGHFFVYLLNNHGNSLSELIGDFQIANNIEAESHTRLYEIWYEQNFDFWSILMGQHDLNSVFAVSETGFFFINSSFGIQPDLSSNFPASIFPLATLGTVIQWRLGENFKALHAVYDGDPGTESSNPNSLKWSLSKEDGALFINEFQYEIKKDSLSQSTFKLGFWKHAQKQRIEDENISDSQGIYTISDHVLYRNPTTGGYLSGFTQLGFSLSSQNPVESYFGGGLLYKGISAKRVNDGLGFAIAHAVFSDFYKSNFVNDLKSETVFELSYQRVTNGRWTFQPNFQYILNPGSENGIANALMGLIRFNFSW